MLVLFNGIRILNIEAKIKVLFKKYLSIFTVVLISIFGFDHIVIFLSTISSIDSIVSFEVFEMPPKKFGNRWENINSVGEGGQSHVFLVKDLNGEFTENCVLKKLKNLNRIKRFEQEIKAGTKLNHPRIAPILHFSLDSEPYFVTKHYSGLTLTKVV